MKATRTIWKTVVFAGAMLGSAACGPKSTTPAADPANAGGIEEAAPTEEGDGMGDGTGGDTYGDGAVDGEEGAWSDPCADRARGGDEEEPCSGRGFILS